MSVPESPYEKKETVPTEKELTLEERVGRVEIVIENAFNALAKGIQEVDLKSQEERRHLEQGISQTLNMINLTVLQNIITVREVTKVLIEKGIVDEKELNAKIETSLKEALEMQRQAIEKAQEEILAAATQAAQEATETTQA